MNNEGVILVLPSWYPSEVDPFSGDFVQRHIEAISAYRQQYVIHVIKDENALITNNVKEVFSKKNNYRELVIYYHIKKCGISILDQFLSDRKYQRVFRKAVRKYIESEGSPALVHVHVAMKAGLIALWIKKDFPFHLSYQNNQQLIYPKQIYSFLIMELYIKGAHASFSKKVNS